MPNPKRDRKRQNAAAARAAQLEAQRQAKRRKNSIRTGILVGFVAVGVVVAALVSAGNDDTGDVASGDSTSTTAAAESTTTSTANPAIAAIECNDTKPEKAGNGEQYDKAPEMAIDKTKKYVATFETSCGTFTAELDAKDAPVAANNFVFLAREGFYDGLKWHRVVPNFVIQGGDPEGTGSGGPGYDVAGEAPEDGYKVGSLAAAKTGADPAGTMGSQFFVVTGANGASLPGDYARFGIVTEGIEVAQKLESFAQGDGPPSRDLYILKVEITESAA